jgi:hypothetical protein
MLALPFSSLIFDFAPRHGNPLWSDIIAFANECVLHQMTITVYFCGTKCTHLNSDDALFC